MKHIYTLSYLLLLSSMGTVQAREVAGADFEKQDSLLELGYGVTVKASESSAAISVIKGSELMKSAATNPLNTLFGKGLGLTVLQNGGTIWENTPTLQIRGLNNIGNNSILVIVDGFERDLGSITKEEIESVQVLKDAAATALYGLRGANGVLFVRTRTGSRKKIDIKVNYEHHFNMLHGLPEMADGYTYALAMNEALANDGLSPRYDQVQLNEIKNGNPRYGNVNWMDEIFKKTSSIDNVFITLSGGGKYVKYFSSMDYLSSKGFIKPQNIVKDYSSQHKYSKLNIRTNIDVDLTSHTKLFFKMNGMLAEHNRPGVGNSDIMNLIYNTPSAAFPVKTPEGDWGGSEKWTRNPVAEVVATGYARSHSRQLFADATISQDLSMLLKGLSADIRVGYDNFCEYWDNYPMSYAYAVPKSAYIFSADDYTIQGQNKTQGFSSSVGGQKSYFNLWGRINYSNEWREHSLDITLAAAREQTQWSGQHNTRNRINLISQAHYTYDGKYIFDFAFSRNGSNALPPYHRFGNFPAVSGAWILSREKFLQNNAFIDLLKIRASWGLTGSDVTPENLMWNRKYGWSGGYILGGEFGSFSGLGEGRLPSLNMTYEKVAKANIGLDMSLLCSIDLTVELFKETRSDIFITPNTISGVLGAAISYQNLGKVNNKGIEIGLRYHKNFRDFQLYGGTNFTFTKNKVIDMGEEYQPYEWMRSTGKAVGQIMGYEAIGFFKNQQDIDNSPRQLFGEVKPGDIKFKDLNGDHIIDDCDKKPIGYSASAPEIYYSINLGAEYKGFGIDALVQGVGNYSAMASTAGLFRPLSNNSSLTTYYYENRWTPQNLQAKYPRLSQDANANNFTNNTVWLADRSYLKLRHAELYYKFSPKLLAATPLRSAKIYVRASDFTLFDHMAIGNPEAMGNVLPIPSSIQAGFSIGF